ncbi:hypothetical protein ACFO3B_42430 [Amycolatopsis samaneae]
MAVAGQAVDPFAEQVPLRVAERGLCGQLTGDGVRTCRAMSGRAA